MLLNITWVKENRTIKMRKNPEQNKIMISKYAGYS